MLASPKQITHVSQGNSICINDTHSTPQDTTSPRQWVTALGLNTSDKDILHSRTAWLTDWIVDATQMLITLLAPVPGLQSVLNGAASTMGFDVQPDEFIQVLNTGSSHWVMVSTIGALHPTVHIYDRLFSQLGAKLQEQNSRSKTPGAKLQEQIATCWQPVGKRSSSSSLMYPCNQVPMTVDSSLLRTQLP